MFEFDEELVWNANRGTGGVINLTPREGQSFNADDDVKLNVYEKGKLNKEPVLSKSAVVAANGSSATISITNNEMELGKVSNKKVEYWYEVKANGSTLIGWDKENGAKVLNLYPEGSED